MHVSEGYHFPDLMVHVVGGISTHAISTSLCWSCTW